MTLPESPAGLLDPSSMHHTRTDLDEEESRHRWDINDNTMPLVSINHYVALVVRFQLLVCAIVYKNKVLICPRVSNHYPLSLIHNM